MITTDIDTTGVSTTGVAASHRSTISEKGAKFIIHILRDTLYTDKILAPIREYSTNAVDAHVEAGCPTKPIRVTLPNSLCKEFKVRDFGKGMSEKKVFSVFSNYGESTKRGTNDQVGMLGIGSKSAFAYTKNFSVITYLSGVKTTYIASIETSDEGDFMRFCQEKTDEPNGTEIVIPVDAKDVNEFTNRAARFFRFWNVMPVFEGNVLSITAPKTEYVGKDKDWYITETDNNATHVLMGNIAYAVRSSEVKWDSMNLDAQLRDALVRLFSNGMVLCVNIGDVDIASNREALQMTTKTCDKLISILKKANDELTAYVDEKAKDKKTNFERVVGIEELRSEKGNFLPRVLRPYYDKYTGNLRTNFDMSACGATVRVYRNPNDGRRIRVYGEAQSQIAIKNRIKYVIDDTKDAHVPRVAGLLYKNQNHSITSAAANGATGSPVPALFDYVYIITVNDQAKWDAWMKVNPLFDMPLDKLSNLPIRKLGEIYGLTTMKRSPEQLARSRSVELLLNVSEKKSCTTRKDMQDYFKITPADPTKEKVYVLIDSYMIQQYSSGSMSPERFCSFLREITTQTGLAMPQIVAVRQKHFDAAYQKNNKSLTQWILEQLKTTAGAKMTDMLLNYFVINSGRSVLDVPAIHGWDASDLFNLYSRGVTAGMTSNYKQYASLFAPLEAFAKDYEKAYKQSQKLSTRNYSHSVIDAINYILRNTFVDYSGVTSEYTKILTDMVKSKMVFTIDTKSINEFVLKYPMLRHVSYYDIQSSDVFQRTVNYMLMVNELESLKNSSAPATVLPVAKSSKKV